MSDNKADTVTTTPNYGRNCIGNVIRILDEYTLIINAGTNKFLHVGEKIIVYTVVDPIFDLDGTLLSMYEYQKDILEVIEVNIKYSICQKKEIGIIDPGIMGELTLSPLFKPKEERIPLDVSPEDISPFKKVPHQIQIGDPVKRAVGISNDK